MKRKVLYSTICLLASLLLAWPAAAQTTSRFNFHVGGGFTEPVRYTDGRLDTGFNVEAGAGVNLAPHLGVMAEFGFNQLALNQTVLSAAGVPGGNARLYSVTLDPIVHLNPRGRFDVYGVGGGGFYRRTIEFTAPTVTTVTAFDPFYGVFFPTQVPATAVLNSFTQNKSGVNVGGGVAIRVKADSNTKFFAESRYHYIYTSPIRTSVLPVTFGLRW